MALIEADVRVEVDRLRKAYATTQTCIDSDQFKCALKYATVDQKQLLFQHAVAGEHTAMRRLMRRIADISLETKNVRDLRKLASIYQIRNYCNMTKEELVIHLRNSKYDPANHED